MHNKAIIIEVIKQDMRFNQYLAALQKLGIYVDDAVPDFLTIVAMLMGYTDFSDEWSELYVKLIGRSEAYEIVPLGNNLYELAEACYEALLGLRAGVEGG